MIYQKGEFYSILCVQIFRPFSQKIGYGGAMFPETPIPAYSLFGQEAGLVEPRFCHVERIGDRWKLHGGQVEEHSHPHLHQMTLWVSGGGQYVADDSVSAISENVLCWMPAGVVHGFRVTPGSEAIVLSMSDDFAREQLASLAAETGLRPFEDRLVLALEGEDSLWLRTLFGRMEREYDLARLGQVDCIGALARLALTDAHRIRRSEDETTAGGSGHSSLLVRFMSLVESRLGERPNVDALAGELGTTPYLLNRACRIGLGLRASEVVRRRHVQEAKRLLLFTALDIGEIGQVLGYPDPAHFARTFRRVTGLSPRAWRESRMDRSSVPDGGQQSAGAAREKADVGAE